MNEFELWIYRGIITIALTILFFLIRYYISQTGKAIKEILCKIDLLINAINELKTSNHLFEERFTMINKRLEDHSTRIRQVEHKVDVCKYCNEK